MRSTLKMSESKKKMSTDIFKLISNKILNKEFNIDIEDVLLLLDTNIDYEVNWNLRQLNIHKLNVTFDIKE